MKPGRSSSNSGHRRAYNRQMARRTSYLILAALLAFFPTLARANATPVAVVGLEIAGDHVSLLVPTAPDAEVIFAIGGEGLYRSDDGGVSWGSAGPAPPDGRLAASGDGSIILAGDRPPCARGGDDTPLSRSSDGGATWQEVAGVAGIRPLAIWPEEHVAIGASCGGLEISTDAGQTWQSLPLPDRDWTPSSLAVITGEEQTGPAALVVGVPEGGGGRLWYLDLTDPAAPQFSDVLKSFWGTAAVAGRDQHYVLGAATGMAISDDGGATWRESRNGLEDATISVDPNREPIPDDELARDFGINTIAIDPTQPDHLYAGTVNGLYASTDDGETWQRFSGVDGAVTILALPARAEHLLFQTEMGVFVLPASD